MCKCILSVPKMYPNYQPSDGTGNTNELRDANQSNVHKSKLPSSNSNLLALTHVLISESSCILEKVKYNYADFWYFW